MVQGKDGSALATQSSSGGCHCVHLDQLLQVVTENERKRLDDNGRNNMMMNTWETRIQEMATWINAVRSGLVGAGSGPTAAAEAQAQAPS